LVIAHAPRERTRRVLKASVSRRRGRVVLTRSLGALERSVHAQLVDVVVIDLGAPGGDALDAVTLARDYPSIAFFAMTPLRPVDAPAIARSAAYEVADILVDGIDDGILRHAIATRGFSARFAAALRVPPPALRLESKLQQAAWRRIVARAGRAVRTQELAAELEVTREHLSRSFAAGARGATGVTGVTLKQTIDLARLLAAAELAKNPGYDLKDVAHILGYASPARLSSASQRLVGVRAGLLSALRAVDLIERFAGSPFRRSR
jgi:AraC-like DNA-binding protein